MAEQAPERVRAVVLAASTGTDAVSQEQGVPTKAMIDIGGQPVVRRTVEALLAAKRVLDVTVAIKPGSPVREAVADLATVVEAQGPTILDTIDAAMALHGGERMLLLATGDLALLTPDSVDDFVAQGLASGAELVYPVVARQVMQTQMPCEQRTFVALRGGDVTGGNLFLISPEFVRRERERIGGIYAARKNAIAMARFFGPGFVVAFVLHLLTLDGVVARAERLLNCRCKVVRSEYPEVAFDIDNPEHVESSRRKLRGEPICAPADRPIDRSGVAKR